MNVSALLNTLVPEIVLVAMACMLFVLGGTGLAAGRRLAPWGALAGLVVAAGSLICRLNEAGADFASQTLISAPFSAFVRVLMLGVGGLLVLLHWPTADRSTGNSAARYEQEGPEYFGLMLLSFAGVMLVAGANDMILLFLGIELAALPTYVMVSISRPISVAQEAAIKYFFLGAFSAALTLFGLSFLFGSTGQLTLSGLMQSVQSAGDTATAMHGWLVIGTLLLILGITFKLAAFPMHFYAPDVYTGAATPLTGLLSFVPKAAGMVALIRVLFAVLGGDLGVAPQWLVSLLWVLAVLTISIGNVLGLMQHNIKRLMACSSIAHSGYMLVGVLVAFSPVGLGTRHEAIQAVLFYLAAYGVMNAGLFAVLMMLPARPDPFAHDGKVPPATSAETFAELAGTGRAHVGLGLIMAGCCFSLIGLPLTVGFFGKFFLIAPALEAGETVLVVIMVINAAISAGYYLRIVATMFLKEPHPADAGDATEIAAATCTPALCMKTVPLVLAGILSAGGSLILGTMIPATTALRSLTVMSSPVVPAAQTDVPSGQGE